MRPESGVEPIDVYRKLVRRESLTPDEEAVVLRALKLLAVMSHGAATIDLAAIEKGAEEAFSVLYGDDDGGWTC